MRPAWGVSSRTRQRARVDFPQPDSPTIPRVSPRATVKLTPLRARMSWTCSPVRRPKKEPWRRKLMDRFSTARKGWPAFIAASGLGDDVVADAGRSVRRRDLDQRRARLAAGIDHEAAARREGAALGQVGEQRRLARNRGEGLAHDSG